MKIPEARNVGLRPETGERVVTAYDVIEASRRDIESDLPSPGVEATR